MPQILLELLAIPAVRAGIIEFIGWVLAESESNPKYRTQFFGLIEKLKDPNLTVEEKQNVLVQLKNLHSSSCG